MAEGRAAEDSNYADDVDMPRPYGGSGGPQSFIAPLGRQRNAREPWPIARQDRCEQLSAQAESDDESVDADNWPVSVDSLYDTSDIPDYTSSAKDPEATAGSEYRISKASSGSKSVHAKQRAAKKTAVPAAKGVALSALAPSPSPMPVPTAAPASPPTPRSSAPAPSAAFTVVYTPQPTSNATVANPVGTPPAASGVVRIATAPVRENLPAIPTQDVMGDMRNDPSSGAGMSYHGHRIVRGVNIGGFLVPEFWITPSMVADIPDPKPGDYLTLCQRLGPEETLRRMRAHWETWVTEAEVQRLAGAGLTHLRIPIGHWEFIDTDEGFVRGGLPYFKRLVHWANKYNMRVIPDMHTAPGSQNGFDNSGTTSGINWTNNPRNVALSKRALQMMLKYIASDPVVLATVDAVDMLNEPLIDALDFDQLWEYDTGGHILISNGLHKVPPVVSIVDRGFKEFSWWRQRWPRDWNSKYIDAWLDAHLYHVFDRNIDNWPLENHLRLVCQNGRDLRSNSTFFPILVGEWSLALPQAALNGRENESRRRFAEAQLDAYEQGGAGWVFWCFKTEASPEWSFLDALDRSWLPQPLTNREFPSICQH
ncbi:hypothetical protein GGF46_000642 [Coemansia sp. RSA 552]|nr:hypothetical protein GGF46_000642 [Coemansia sp. RSA 552]